MPIETSSKVLIAQAHHRRSAEAFQYDCFHIADPQFEGLMGHPIFDLL
jgi:hypothetical protein